MTLGRLTILWHACLAVMAVVVAMNLIMMKMMLHNFLEHSTCPLTVWPYRPLAMGDQERELQDAWLAGGLFGLLLKWLAGLVGGRLVGWLVG